MGRDIIRSIESNSKEKNLHSGKPVFQIYIIGYQVNSFHIFSHNQIISFLIISLTSLT